jgi:hypothetical protein
MMSAEGPNRTNRSTEIPGSDGCEPIPPVPGQERKRIEDEAEFIRTIDDTYGAQLKEQVKIIEEDKKALEKRIKRSKSRLRKLPNRNVFFGINSLNKYLPVLDQQPHLQRSRGPSFDERSRFIRKQ